MSNYFLWPYKDEKVLQEYLKTKRVDLRKTTPCFKIMQEGDKVYFCLSKGTYVASAYLDSKPKKQEKPLRDEFPWAIELTKVTQIKPPVTTGWSPRGVTCVPEPLINHNWPYDFRQL
jgi:hypothetical protein